MKKRFLIIHGWEATSQDNWFPEEKRRLETMGYNVTVPDMPNTLNPLKEEWVKVIEDYNPNEDSILIGHSLGGLAILRYLEKALRKVGKCVFIATPIRKNEKLDFDSTPIHNFFKPDIDYSRIKKNCDKFIIINQKNDPLVPLQDGKDLVKYIGGDLKILEGNNHLCQIDLDSLEEIIF